MEWGKLSAMRLTYLAAPVNDIALGRTMVPLIANHRGFAAQKTLDFHRVFSIAVSL